MSRGTVERPSDGPKKMPAPTNPKVHRNRLAETMGGEPVPSREKKPLFANYDRALIAANSFVLSGTPTS